MLDAETRDAVRQHIKWALAAFDIPEEYHHRWKDDPLYVPGEPISVVDILPSIKGLDPAGHKLFDQIVEAAVEGVEKALDAPLSRPSPRRAR
jgi:hypothetical protein